MSLQAPMFPPVETGVLELVGANEQVDQNEFGAAVSYDLIAARPMAGALLAVTLLSSEAGTGAIQTPAGQLLVFDADPGHSAGDDGSGISAAEWQGLIAAIDVQAVDWTAEDNGAFCNLRNFEPIPFHRLSTLYFVWRHTDAISLNDAAGDDEVLSVNVWLQLLG